MDLTIEINDIIGSPESEELEYKAILPPSKQIAKIISALANTKGGYLILGVVEDPNGIRVNGLSQEFHTNLVAVKAIDLLTPKPNVVSQYVEVSGKKVYAFKVNKSKQTIKLGEDVFIRKGTSVQSNAPVNNLIAPKNFLILSETNTLLNSFRNNATNSKINALDHYQGVLNIIKELSGKLYPITPERPPIEKEGKILIRILFSSIVDNFETYLSELLYEIFLGLPSTLKNNQQVSIEEVLNCANMQEFIQYWAKKKINKLQKGSVKGFIKENKQIRELGVLDKKKIQKIEKILQIRHLYSHRNGIVDDQFLIYFFGEYSLNQEHEMSAKMFCTYMKYLSERIHEIDIEAVKKYLLATLD